MKIYCLFTRGGALSHHESLLLYQHAVSMKSANKRRMRRTCPDCHSTLDIRTEFKEGALGAITGIVFDAVIVSPDGENEVRYLIRADGPPRNGKHILIGPLPRRAYFESDGKVANN